MLEIIRQNPTLCTGALLVVFATVACFISALFFTITFFWKLEDAYTRFGRFAVLYAAAIFGYATLGLEWLITSLTLHIDYMGGGGPAYAVSWWTVIPAVVWVLRWFWADATGRLD